MDKATKIPRESPSLLEQVVEKYEAKIKKLQEEIKKSKADSTIFQQKSEDLEMLRQELKQEVSKEYYSYHSLECLIEATHIPILFLDEDLRIQYYTPALEEVFNRAEFNNGDLLSDVLRPSTFKKLNHKIQQCFQNPDQQEVRFYLNELQQWYLTRILTYSAVKDEPNGVLITFLNITEDKEYEKQLSKLNRNLELEVQKQNQQVKKLASELIEAEQNERKRIAKLLHNDLQQLLFSIQTKVKFLEKDVPGEFAEKLTEVNEQLDYSLKLTHQLVVNLSPPNIKNNNLRRGINWLCEYIYNLHGLWVQVQAPRHIELENRDVLVLLLQIIQEYLFNIVKHAGVDEAKITITQQNEDIIIHISDQGKGFDQNNVKKTNSFGIAEAKENLELMGGNVFISSTPGKGTDIYLSIPRQDHIKPCQLNLKI